MDNENTENENENEKYDFYKYGQNFGVQFQTGEEKYYDIIIDIDSMTKLFKDGWELLYTEKGEKNYEIKKVKNLTVVAVIGNKNKGKSYILQKISGNKLPLGYSVTTKGISILYPKNLNQNIILLDSAGFEVPLLEIPGVYEFEIIDKEKKKFFEEKLAKINEEIKQSNTNKDKDKLENYIKEKNELLLNKKNEIKFEDKGTQIAQFTKDRRLTDYFLQKFILWNSDILLCVVGQLTFSDQKFINTIRSQINNRKKKKLFIIHNLTTFVEKKQVEDYIENTLMKSYTFELEKIQIPKFGEKNDNENQYYWREKNLSKNDNSGIDIIHLIMANDDDNSEAGLFYNDSTIEYIKKQIMAYVDYSKFDIKKLLKNFLIEISKEILEKQLEADDIIEKENKIIVENKEFQLKNCLMDELGTNTFVDVNYKPKHRRYKTTIDNENRYVIEVEIPGGVKDFKQTLDNKVGNNIITIRGKKKNIKITNKNVNKEKANNDEKKEENKKIEKKENANNDKKKEDDKNKEKKENANNDKKKEDDKNKEKKKDDKKKDKKVTKNTENKKNTENDIEWKPFELDIKIPLDVVQLDKFLKCEKENGIYKLYYSIITNDSDSDTVNLENEEEEDEEDDENDNNDDEADDDDDNNNNNNNEEDEDDRDKETNENETKATESKNNNDDDGSDDSD